MSNALLDRLNNIRRCIDSEIKESRLVTFLDDLTIIGTPDANHVAIQVKAELEELQ